MATPHNFDSHMDEMLGRGGTFDITGTELVENKQFWGFYASEGAVINAIKGIAIKTIANDLAAIRTAEVSLAAILLTGASDPLLGNTLYRADGYIITSIDLTSGTLHCLKTTRQISA